jgi:hypothetical protein
VPWSPTSRRGFRPALSALEDRRLLSFAAPVDYVVGTQAEKGLNGFASQVITGDFHGNGKLDLVVSNKADGTISILTGNGNGTFQAPVTYSTGLGANNPDWLAAADFNGDTKLDLAVEGDNGQISIMLGNGDGTFATPKIYSVGTGDRGGLAVGDFFGNGRQDIAVAIFSNPFTVAILPNNGDGTFGAVVSLPMPSGFHNIRSVTTANFFGNGYADLAVAGGEGYNNTILSTDPAGVALFKNDGKGHFTFTAEYQAVVTPDPSGGNGTGDTVNPEHVNAYDLTGNGRQDIVLSLYDHNIDVFMNNGNGTFQPAVAYNTETPDSVGGYPRGVVFGDFNGDGKVDIASLNFGEPVPADQSAPQPGSVGILYGNGDGTFQPPVEYTPFLLPGSLAVGDFNNGGLPDLAVMQNYTFHSLGVMMNQPGTAQEPPAVTAIAPPNGPTSGGTVVTITGANFTGTSQVSFGIVPASAFTVNSDTSITATSPAESAGQVDVTVYNAGASATSAADRFTFMAASTYPQLAGPWWINGNQSTQIQQNGANLTFTNENGQSSPGYFQSATQVVATGWGNLTGTLVPIDDGLRIAWSNGTKWDQLQLAGQGFIGSRNVRIDQSGNTLTFTNESGNMSPGTIVDATHVMATGWGNLVGTLTATFEGFRVNWANGTSWDMLRLAGTWSINGNQPTQVAQPGNGTLVTFTNELGASSPGSIQDTAHVIATGWGNLVGTLVAAAGQIQIDWANGTVWVKPQLGQ